MELEYKIIKSILNLTQINAKLEMDSVYSAIKVQKKVNLTVECEEDKSKNIKNSLKPSPKYLLTAEMTIVSFWAGLPMNFARMEIMGLLIILRMIKYV